MEDERSSQPFYLGERAVGVSAWETRMDQKLQELFDGVVDGKAPVVQQKVQEALDASLDPAVILNDGMIAAMREVGHRFEVGKYYVPEMLISARAMKMGLAILQPHLQQANVKTAGTVVAGTVRGDLHDIGKNLVCMMLQGAGFEIQDLGTNVSPDKIVEAVRTKDANIVALSALLTTTMPAMKDTIAALERAGVRGQVKVIVGGAPITDAYAREIGADGYAADASRAVTLAQSLLA
jgi:5-methyltetrahydrofolate--homocysteine methyltransferase